jgi:putative chitinase
MIPTIGQIAVATGSSVSRAARWEPHLAPAMRAYEINTPKRMAAFLAQVGHESGSLQFVHEIWGPTDAQRRYDGRADLGNTELGDGYRFRGHGLIQTTGRANHRRVRDRLRAKVGPRVPDFEDDPSALALPEWAAWSAADYWDDKGLNALADADEFERITRRINGGLNGQPERVLRWMTAKAAFGIE